jgi:prophage antirepressor-like protein
MELINQIDTTFNFNTNSIRVLGNPNSPLFVAKDICNILELTNVTEALKNIPEKWKKFQNLTSVSLMSGSKHEQCRNMIVLSEPAVYKLIMRSNKAIAQTFQDFVCEEILPSIRKHGEYKLQKLLEEKEEKLKRVEEEKNKLIEKYNKNTNRTFKPNHGIYVGINELEKDVFKVGITVNPNSRISSLSTGTTTDFKIKKFWKTRFHKEIEDAVKKNFSDYRILIRKEFFEIYMYDRIVEYIEKAVTFFNENDILETEPEIEEEIIPEPIIEYVYVESDRVEFEFIDTNRTDKKSCTKCLLYLPLSSFYLRNENNNKELPENINEEEKQKFFEQKYRSHCKKCYSKEEKLLKEKIKANPNHLKKECDTCNNLLNFQMFYKNADDTLFSKCINCYNINNNLTDVKQCTGCKDILKFTQFSKDKTHKDGLRTSCKKCVNDKNKEKSNNSNNQVKCQFCNLTIKYKNNLLNHQKSKTCLVAQEKLKNINES